MTIYPYLLGDTCWVFDDERTGLKEEAFVFGMTEMISRFVAFESIPNADQGFALTFGAEPFDHGVELTWLSPTEVAEEFNCPPSHLPSNGNWYRGLIAGEEMVGWLCPALFCYFDQAPAKIYVKAEPLPAGFDPIWHIKADDPRAKRFVSAPG
jgi:hypothetical protein